jgi:hypothetical protein
MECPGVFPVGVAPPRRCGVCLPLSVLRTGPLGPRGLVQRVEPAGARGRAQRGDAAGQLGEVVWHPSNGTIMALTGLPSPTGCDPGWQGPALAVDSHRLAVATTADITLSPNGAGVGSPWPAA